MASSESGNLRSSSIELSSNSSLSAIDNEDQTIHVRCAGASPPAGTPSIVIVAGMGSECLSFSTVQRGLAAKGLYSLSYDRMGTGRSSSLPTFPDPENSDHEKPLPRTAVQLAEELQLVLKAADVVTPYILVGHSYAGVILCEYIALYPHNVVGLVFVDANSARSPERTELVPLEVLYGDFEDKIDYYEESGLSKSHKLLAQEWSEIIGKQTPEGWPQGKHGGFAEHRSYTESCKALAEREQTKKRVMGRRPVSVLKGYTAGDLRRLLDALDRVDVEGREKRDDVRSKLDQYDELEEDQQRELMRLTADGKARMTVTHNSGHHVHITEPGLVIAEVEWIVKQL